MKINTLNLVYICLFESLLSSNYSILGVPKSYQITSQSDKFMVRWIKQYVKILFKRPRKAENIYYFCRFFYSFLLIPLNKTLYEFKVICMPLLPKCYQLKSFPRKKYKFWNCAVWVIWLKEDLFYLLKLLVEFFCFVQWIPIQFYYFSLTHLICTNNDCPISV